MQRFTDQLLELDAEREVERIAGSLKKLLSSEMRRRGFIIALSGGVESSVTAALCVRAVGRQRVLGLLLPERNCSPVTVRLSKLIVEHLDIPFVQEDITQALEAFGCYRRQEEAIKLVIADYGPGWKAKIVLPSVLERESLRLFSAVAVKPDGEVVRARLTRNAYLGILAATNFKQRVRKVYEYYYADRYNFAAAGTPNRLEYDQGFFVKPGDGAADVKPIAHLYKTQVYQLAAYLGIPDEIRSRPPTTDTYSMPQSQEEFYFSLPYEKMDICLFGKDNCVAVEEIAEATGLSANQVKRVFDDIDQKRRTTRYLHLSPLLVMETGPDL